MVIYMAVGGEMPAELPDMLEKAADHLDQEFEDSSDALSLIEPAIIILMGAMVAGVWRSCCRSLQLNQLTLLMLRFGSSCSPKPQNP